MKRILTAFLATVLLLSLSCSAFAAEPEDGSGDVYAKIVDQTENKYKAPVEEGEAKTELPDGTKIEAEEIPVPEGESYHLVVIPVTDPDAKAWFEEQTRDSLRETEAYEIYLENSRGHRVAEPEEMKVTITLPEPLQDPRILSVAPDGSGKELQHTAEENGLSFRTAPNGFYAVGEKYTAPAEPDPEIPQTGAREHTALLVTSALVSAGCVGLILVAGKKKKEEQ